MNEPRSPEQDVPAQGGTSASPVGTAAGADPATEATVPRVVPTGDDAGSAQNEGSTADPVLGQADADDAHADSVAAWRTRNDKRRKNAKKRPWWVEIPLLLVTAFVLTFLIQTFLFKVYYVPSGSMEPTLHGVPEGGDRILVNKVVYDFRDPAPGDIVVFKGPDNWALEVNSIPGPTSFLGKIGEAIGSVVGIAPPNEKDYVKRVIAVGGQTVQCCDAQGRVEVDGVPLDEPYVMPENEIPFQPGIEDCTTKDNISQRCFGPVTVPQGQLWMMGDNRIGSGDSTLNCQRLAPVTSCQGPVPVDNVIGKAIFVLLPASRWHTLGDPGIDHRGG